MTTCCSSNTLFVGRPTQEQYDKLCNSSGNSATVANCGTSSCGSFLKPNGRMLSPRKFREKVRNEIKDAVLLLLGAPTIKIELDDQHLDMTIDYVLKVIEEYAGPEHFDYYNFYTTPGKSVYKLPDDVGIVRNVYYKEQGNFGFAASDLGGVIPVEYFYPGGSYMGMSGGLMNPTQPVFGRMGEWTLYNQTMHMFNRLSSNIGGWEWVSDLGHIKLYPVPCKPCRVIVHYLQKCKDWKETTQAMIDGVYAMCLIALGNIRGKYPQLPGPGGGMSMDGDFMRNKGYELKEKWEEQLLTRYGEFQLPITLD